MMTRGALVLLAGLAPCGAKEAEESGGPRHLALVYTNNLDGEIEPCG